MPPEESHNQATLTIGQAVPWDPSPTGWAQIEDLHSAMVTIIYRSRRGTWKRPRVRVEQLQPMLLDLHNPYQRAAPPRSRTYGYLRMQTQSTNSNAKARDAASGNQPAASAHP